MEVRKKLKPSAHGTKRLLREYGEKRICVRYRYDDENHKRYTTVELIVDQQPHYRILPHAKALSAYKSKEPDPVLNIRISFRDIETRNQVKNAGGIWDTKKKCWKLKNSQINKLGLEKRIINDA